MDNEYKDINIQSEIEKKIRTFNKVRISRINMSLRFKEYSEKWKFLIFALNTEAVVLVLLSLGGHELNQVFRGTLFNVISGVFAIYVILIQYYVNELNYNERALKVHYHQLDIEDLILRLKGLLVKVNSKQNSLNERDLIDRFDTIMYEYQAIIKNNENHDPVDFERGELNILQSKEKIKIVKDRTVDNVVFYINLSISILVPLLIAFIIIFRMVRND